MKPSTATEGPWLSVVGPGAGAYGAWVGKWLLHVPVAEVDRAWAIVAMATLMGQLGPRAKVSTAAHPGNTDGRRVVCVFTADCQDRADVSRVLAMLRRLGWGGRLSYKEDGATYSGRYGRGAALYVAQPEREDFEQRRDPVPVPVAILESLERK